MGGVTMLPPPDRRGQTVWTFLALPDAHRVAGGKEGNPVLLALQCGEAAIQFSKRMADDNTTEGTA